MTRHVSFSDFRKNPTKYVEEVTDTGASLHIEHEAGSVVMITKEEFEGWMETVHLLRSPANASRLLSAVDEADGGKLDERRLIEKK